MCISNSNDNEGFLVETSSVGFMAKVNAFKGFSWVKFYVFILKVKVAQSCPTLPPHGLYSPWNSPGQNTGVGRLSLLLGIFPTHRLNPGLSHCSWILVPAEPQGKPILSQRSIVSHVSVVD